MDRDLDIELSRLTKQLVVMAGYLEAALERASQGWHTPNLAREVYVIEDKVNQAHKEIDEACVRLLALKQPMAADLRYVVAILKINTDLERMSDMAVNIASTAEYYLKEPASIDIQDLDDMAELVRQMVSEVLTALVRTDLAMAKGVLLRDDRVDAYKRKIYVDMVNLMKESPENVEPAMQVALIAKNLERIGDHATNIAEDIVFIESGQDIRHSQAPHVSGGQ